MDLFFKQKELGPKMFVGLSASCASIQPLLKPRVRFMSLGKLVKWPGNTRDLQFVHKTLFNHLQKKSGKPTREIKNLPPIEELLYALAAKSQN